MPEFKLFFKSKVKTLQSFYHVFVQEHNFAKKKLFLIHTLKKQNELEHENKSNRDGKRKKERKKERKKKRKKDRKNVAQTS